MAKVAKEIAENCRICLTAKYDRHPRKQELGETPIPETSGEFLHIDIFSTDKKFFLTCVDKFSKFAVVQSSLCYWTTSESILLMRLRCIAPPMAKRKTLATLLKS